MARDYYHKIAREILENEGWLITDDPLIIRVGGVQAEVDLGAEQVIAAERAGEKIAVEIKSFLGKSKVHEFYGAKGQFDLYWKALHKKQNERTLYLGIEEGIYNSFFQKELIAEMVEEDSINLWVFSANHKKSVLWKKW